MTHGHVTRVRTLQQVTYSCKIKLKNSFQPAQPLYDEWKTCQALNEFVVLSDN